MSSSRRQFLSAAGFGSLGTLILAGNLPGVGVRRGIDPDGVAVLEELYGLDFSAAERAILAKELNESRRLWTEAPIIGPDIAPSFGAPPEAAAPRTPRPLVDRESVAPKLGTEHDLAYQPAWRLGRLIQEGKITSRQLTELYLARLEKRGKALHCVVHLCRERALEQAARADAEIAAGRVRSPLHGVPWGVKDLFSTRDMPTSWGAKPFEGRVIEEDAEVVSRLDEAGCVLLGKLSVGALAMGDVWYGGMTRNPWNPREGSSGSSAGSAAAVAAGLVGFAIGTETLGSIVSPASRCGVTGLRPTFGRVSRHGVMPLAWSMDKVGPLARCAVDCGLVYSLIAGPDGRDPHLADRDAVEGEVVAAKDLRVGVLDEAPGRRGRDENAALDVFKRMGIDVVPVAVPTAPDSLWQILQAEAAASFDEITRDGRIRELTEQGPGSWPRIFRKARFIPAVEYLRASRERTVLREAMSDAMHDIDVLVAPVYRGGALKTTNFSGHPSIVVPSGFSPRGMPRAITLIGRLWGERALVTLAQAYQDATGHHLKRPPG